MMMIHHDNSMWPLQKHCKSAKLPWHHSDQISDGPQVYCPLSVHKRDIIKRLDIFGIVSIIRYLFWPGSLLPVLWNVFSHQSCLTSVWLISCKLELNDIGWERGSMRWNPSNWSQCTIYGEVEKLGSKWSTLTNNYREDSGLQIS